MSFYDKLIHVDDLLPPWLGHTSLACDAIHVQQHYILSKIIWNGDSEIEHTFPMVHETDASRG